MTMPTLQVIITQLDNFSIMHRESHTIARTIMEALFIRVNDPSSMGMIASTSYPTYGIRSCSIPLTSTSNRHSQLGQLAHCARPTTQVHQAVQGAHTLSTVSTVHKYGSSNITNFGALTTWHQVPLFLQPVVPFMVNIDFGKCNILSQT